MELEIMSAVKQKRRFQIGNRIRSARSSQGLSQTLLARAVGVSQATLARWESGQRDLDVSHLESLARVLAIPALQLVRGRATLPSSAAALSVELCWWGLDLQAGKRFTVWAVREVEEVIVAALTAPDPRVLDRLPALFFQNPTMRPAVLWGHAEDQSVEQRLGWLIDVALEIVEHGRGQMTDVLRDTRLDQRIEINRATWTWDGLGSPCPDRTLLEPIWKRWRIDYDRRFVQILSTVLQTLEVVDGA